MNKGIYVCPDSDSKCDILYKCVHFGGEHKHIVTSGDDAFCPKKNCMRRCQTIREAE